MSIHVISFGYGHGDPPEADIVVDVRRSLRNPHREERFRELDAFHPEVFAHVRDTFGTMPLIRNLAEFVLSQSLFTSLQFTVAIGCVGGRHRAPSLAMLLSEEIERGGADAFLTHRDVDKPVLGSKTHDLEGGSLR